MNESEELYPIDQEKVEEQSRLDKQAKALNTAVPLPSVFATLADTQEKRVLDLACGPGTWSRMAAQRFPAWAVTGMDISQRMIKFAQVAAKANKVNNVKFQVADALKPLPFADGSLDFIHARALQGFVPVKHWPTLLAECWRVLCPGGVLQAVESERPVTNAPANTRLNALLSQALFFSGVTASPDGQQFGIVHVLPDMIQSAGFVLDEYTAHPINYSWGHAAHDIWCQNITEAFKLMPSFLMKPGNVTREEIDGLLTELQREIDSPDYRAVIAFFSVCARKP